MKTGSKIAIAVAAIGAWLFARKNKSVSGIGYARRRYFGGNSGYDGYSMSVRAREARADGKYPKTDFKKAYGLSTNVFNLLVGCEIIGSHEWHHTSSWGNQTLFWEWEDPDLVSIYEQNKQELSKLAKDDRIIVGGYTYDGHWGVSVPRDIKERVWEIFDV